MESLNQPVCIGSVQVNAKRQFTPTVNLKKKSKQPPSIQSKRLWLDSRKCSLHQFFIMQSQICKNFSSYKLAYSNSLRFSGKSTLIRDSLIRIMIMICFIFLYKGHFKDSLYKLTRLYFQKLNKDTINYRAISKINVKCLQCISTIYN